MSGGCLACSIALGGRMKWVMNLISSESQALSIMVHLAYIEPGGVPDKYGIPC